MVHGKRLTAGGGGHKNKKEFQFFWMERHCKFSAIFATDRKNRKIKIVCRHQQYDAANKIVERVVQGRTKKGLIWHFQGSGKSLLMVFAAQKLRLHPKLKSPTVIIVVDRIDLDTQITATFTATAIPNTIPATSRDELKKLLDTVQTDKGFSGHYPLLLLLARTGVRVGEAIALRRSDIDFNTRSLKIERTFYKGRTGTPKNGKPRTVDMPWQLRDALLKSKKTRTVVPMDEDLDWVFTQEGRGLILLRQIMLDLQKNVCYLSPYGTRNYISQY